jgi:coenzyme F420-0:L-glutamate ligase/coenzyme F420-1:gamma-L-glutamate ligase
MLKRIFAAVAAAPSAHNRQPWRYLVLRDLPFKQKLASSMGAQLALDRLRDGDDEKEAKRDVELSYARITGAPVVIVVCLTLEDMDGYRDPDRSAAEFLMAVQSTAMATQNLLLAARAEGLGACFMCAPLFCPAIARHALAIAQSWHPQGLVTLGYPADSGRPRRRKRMPEFVQFDCESGPADA